MRPLDLKRLTCSTILPRVWRRLMPPMLLLAAMLPNVAVRAATYPMTVTDLTGRTVTIPAEPQRVVLQDGRELLTLALLDRDDPFRRLVAWNNLIEKSDPRFWALLAARWPDAGHAMNMQFGDKGEVNLEQIVARKPQLVIAEARAAQAFADAGITTRLAALHIPVLFVDLERKPVEDVPRTVALLGRVLDREAEARAYTDFYAAHLAHLRQILAVQKTHPSIFIEAKAGLADDCCFTHGKSGFGLLAEAAGGRNIGSALLPGPSGTVPVETVLARDPDVLVMSGASWTGANTGHGIPLGYGIDAAQAHTALAHLAARTGIAQLKAVRDGRTFALEHLFYSSPYNIVGVEYLARFLYPRAFDGLDPAETYARIIHDFTRLPQDAPLLAVQAPAVD